MASPKSILLSEKLLTLRFLIFNLYCKVELGKGGLGNGRERIVFEEIKSYVYTGARELGQEN